MKKNLTHIWVVSTWKGDPEAGRLGIQQIIQGHYREYDNALEKVHELLNHYSAQSLNSNLQWRRLTNPTRPSGDVWSGDVWSPGATKDEHEYDLPEIMLDRLPLDD